MTIRPPGPTPDAEATLVLVRHGRTAWNAEGRFLGRTDVPLDPEGLRQAAALCAFSGAFDAVFTSPLLRARGTAASLAPPEPRVDDDLAEVDQGDLEGWPVAEGVARWPAFFEAFRHDPAGVRIPGGETLPEVVDRMRRALARIRATGLLRVAAVGHQMAIAALAADLAEGTPAAWRSHRLGHGEGLVLAWRPGAPPTGSPTRTGGGWVLAGRWPACENGP